ncbi:hypothetical protein ZWY2020_016062 [Hordeum vulgare]|nr:hypothetical protein ZWY2020_016062 [Hordeum vulgare]
MHHAVFASMVADMPEHNLKYFNHKYNTRYLKHDDSVSLYCMRIRSIVLSILHLEQARSSLDWERVRCKASQIVQYLAYKAPELRNLALLPGGPMMLHDVLPIIFRYRRRRHMKEQDLPAPKTLAKIYLRTKKSLPSLTRSHELNSGAMPYLQASYDEPIYFLVDSIFVMINAIVTAFGGRIDRQDKEVVCGSYWNAGSAATCCRIWLST